MQSYRKMTDPSLQRSNNSLRVTVHWLRQCLSALSSKLRWWHTTVSVADHQRRHISVTSVYRLPRSCPLPFAPGFVQLTAMTMIVPRIRTVLYGPFGFRFFLHLRFDTVFFYIPIVLSSTRNSAIRSADPENLTLEPNMKWIELPCVGRKFQNNDVMAMGHGSCGSWVNCVMGHMDRGSRKMTNFHLSASGASSVHHWLFIGTIGVAIWWISDVVVAVLVFSPCCRCVHVPFLLSCFTSLLNVDDVIVRLEIVVRRDFTAIMLCHWHMHIIHNIGYRAVQ